MDRVVVDVELGRGFGYGLEDIGHSGFEIAITWSDVDGFLHWPGSGGRALLDYLLDHQQIVGYNLLAYDNQVLAGYLLPSEAALLLPDLKERTVDLHALLYQATGQRHSLESVARATLAEGKIRPPADPNPLLLAEYCERDVELTRDLDDHRRLYGVLYVRNGVAVHLPHTKGGRMNYEG